MTGGGRTNPISLYPATASDWPGGGGREIIVGGGRLAFTSGLAGFKGGGGGIGPGDTIGPAP